MRHVRSGRSGDIKDGFGGAGGGEAFRRRPLWRNLRAALARRSFVTLEWGIWDAGNYMAIGDLMAATCL